MHFNKKYGHIISLGYNCEVSFQFFLKYHFVESSLFAWVNSRDCQYIINALQNLNILATKGFEAKGFMYKDLASGISFHAKEDKGETDQEKRQELKSRINYLREKFLKTASDGKNNLYIFKYPTCKKSEQEVQKEILDLFKTLKKIVVNKFDLLIILEGTTYASLNINRPNIFIERVNYFAADKAVTTHPYDEKGWNKIFSKYKPNFKLPHQMVFKFEDTDNVNQKHKEKEQLKKYDLIFSMGEACSCPSLLIMAKLRKFRVPFDWVGGKNFLERTQLLTSGFKHFLEKEDLVYTNCNNGDQKNLCDIYKNTYTKMVFNHDFPAGVELNLSYPSIKEKYNQRIARLLKKIKESSSILIVYLGIPLTKLHLSNQEILQGWEELHKKYPGKKIDILYFENDENLKSREYKKFNLSQNVIKIVGNYQDQQIGASKYSVDFPFLLRFMQPYALNFSFKEKIKNKLIKYSIKCIALRFLRKRLKKKYHL